MSSIASESVVSTRETVASRLARSYWAANLSALHTTQPQLRARLDKLPTDMEWVIARDGSLTAIKPDGRWWAGCSVPDLAGKKLLHSLESSTLVSAFLSPAHVGLLKAAMERLEPGAALIAIVPDQGAAEMLLATGNFVAEIAAHRLWFVVGDQWPEALHALLIDRPGLPPPGRFIRTKLTEPSADEAMIAAAQAVLGEIANTRLSQLEQLQNRPARKSGEMRRPLIIQPSRFRLWNDGSDVLEQFSREFAGEVVRFDSDDPVSSSLIALAQAAADCDAVLAANVYRQTVPGVVPNDIPWLTWVTRGPVPAPDGASACDKVIAADESLARLAREAGWPDDRIIDAEQRECDSSPTSSRLAIIADLQPVSIPPAIEDLSSHRLLWEHIDAQIALDPFVVGNDPLQYLLSCAQNIDITADELDVPAFVDRLIIPRWQRAIASRMIHAGMPIDVYGAGWIDEPALAQHAAGPLHGRGEFEDACRTAAALVHVWPGVKHHPIHHAGRPVITVTDSWPLLLNGVKAALAAASRPSSVVQRRPAIPMQKILHLDR